MKRAVTSVLAALCLYALPGNAGNDPLQRSVSRITFTENKGQVSDQFHQPRPDVLFSGTTNGMTYHLKREGISYQLSRIDAWRKESGNTTDLTHQQKQVPDKIAVYRLDIGWMNMNKNSSQVTDEALPGYENFYFEVCPAGVKNVKTYTGVTYKNIYPSTDLHYYEKDGDLKYDFILAPGADYKKIQLRIDGAKAIALQKDGSVALSTPLGNITEGAPLVFQGGRQLTAAWKINENILSFDIKHYDPALPLIIDPAVRIWGTYYSGGPAAYESGYPMCTLNGHGDVFLTGSNAMSVGTNIATSGSHQSTIGGNTDAYLVKFDNAGHRQWATYYGGAQDDLGHSCATDASGNIYMSGMTESIAAIATAGAYQPIKGSGQDAYLVKFDPSGARLWATYYGGTGTYEDGYGCTVDASGNVILNGFTNSPDGIATPGSHQETFGGGFADIFIVKFSAGGVRQWGTYYGGPDSDLTYRKCASDPSGNLYLCGKSDSPTSTVIATPGSHQSSYGGGLDGDVILVKFNSTGVRQWATYYGGSGTDVGFGCALDNSGNVYISGYTETYGGTSIATPGSHQPSHSGDDSRECFLAKFSPAGVRAWGTYYGGTGSEFHGTCETNATGHVFLTGATSSTASIATPGSHQDTYAGNNRDGFIVEFDAAGVRQWGSYYGGPYSDYISDVCIDPYGTIYTSGYTSPSLSGIATPGSYQDTPLAPGSWSSFLVRLNNNCITPSVPAGNTPTSNLSICHGNNATLTVAGTGWMNWYSTATSTTAIGTGTALITPTLATGTHTYYAEAYTCTNSISRTAITVSVSSYTVPVISAASGSICEGGSFIIIPSGADTYTFSGGSALVSPTITTSYSVSGTSTSGCVSPTVAILTVTVHARPFVSVNSGTICSGTIFTLIPSGASAYLISGGSSQVSPLTTTNYSVAGTSSVGCASSNTAVATVSVFTSPLISVNSGSICSGQSFSIIPSGANTYTFLNGATSVTPGVTTTYSIIGTATNNCASSNTAVTTITVSPTPTITVNSGAICAGQVFTIIPSGAYAGGTYIITPGNTVHVSPATTSSYSVTGTSTAGCVSTNTVTSSVTVYSLPVVSALNGAMCSGRVFTITASGATSYSINGMSSANLTVSPGAMTDFSITGTSADNCTSSNTAVITVSVNTTPTVSVNSGSICSGESFTIIPSGFPVGPLMYNVSGGSFTVTPGTSMDYSVTGTSAEGCISDVAVASVTVHGAPLLTANSGSICSGQTFTLLPAGAASYSINGTSSTVFTVNPVTNTDYSITGVSGAGCVSTNTAVSSVIVIALPVVAVNSGSLCNGQIFTLTPTGAVNYSVNGTATSIFTVSPPMPGMDYTITGAGASGCLSSNAAVSSLTVLALPLVSVNSGSICAGSIFTLTPAGAASYSLNGSLITDFTVSPAATTAYTLTGSDISGCISQKAVSSISVHAGPTIAVNSGSICMGQSFTIVPTGAASYTISGGAAVVSPTVTKSYQVTGTSSLGCISANTATAIVGVVFLPTVAITGNQFTVCAGEPFVLHASGADTYVWSTGDNTGSISITPSVTTAYTVIGTALTGCSNTYTVLQVVDQCTGFKQNTSAIAGISIYPNPNNGRFHIEIQGGENALRLEIYNALGQSLQSYLLNDTRSYLDISTHANGIYFIRIFEKGTLLRQEKIIKE